MTDIAVETAMDASEEWFITLAGQRQGPLASDKLIELLSALKIDGETPVWHKGQKDWLALRDTALAIHLSDAPPPVAADALSNGLVWTLAVAPIPYVFVDVAIQSYIGRQPFDDTSFIAALTYVIPAACNAALCLLDERQLKQAGYADSWLTTWAILLAPAYLFLRAKRLRRPPIYAWAWVATFILSIILQAA